MIGAIKEIRMKKKSRDGEITGCLRESRDLVSQVTGGHIST